MPPPRRFSQATTSFIASSCQGIHPVRFVTWPYNPKECLGLVFSVQARVGSVLAAHVLKYAPRLRSDPPWPERKILSPTPLRFMSDAVTTKNCTLGSYRLSFKQSRCTTVQRTIEPRGSIVCLRKLDQIVKERMCLRTAQSEGLFRKALGFTVCIRDQG